MSMCTSNYFNYCVRREEPGNEARIPRAASVALARPIGLYVPNSASASTCTAGHVPTTTICASQKMETAPYLVVTISRHRTVVP